MTDDLNVRTGLPEAFRYLEASYPRHQWPTLDLNPSALHWLEIHDWFRGQMTDLESLGSRWREGRMNASDYRVAAMPRLRQLLNYLHHHHERESNHAFPLMVAAEPRMAEGFALLDRDHDAIEHLLSEIAQGANGLIRAGDAPKNLAPFADALSDRVERGTMLIGRHLADEEEIIVPVLTLKGDQIRF